jgi:hypothetical protein
MKTVPNNTCTDTGTLLKFSIIAEVWSGKKLATQRKRATETSIPATRNSIMSIVVLINIPSCRDILHFTTIYHDI